MPPQNDKQFLHPLHAFIALLTSLHWELHDTHTSLISEQVVVFHFSVFFFLLEIASNPIRKGNDANKNFRAS